MLADKVGDGGIEVGIPAGKAGDGGFGPDEQVGLVGQGLLGEVYEFVEPLQVPAGVPDQRLRNAGLNEGDVQGAIGGGIPGQLPEAEVEDEGDDQGGRMISLTQAERVVGRSTIIRPAESSERETQTIRNDTP